LSTLHPKNPDQKGGVSYRDVGACICQVPSGRLIPQVATKMSTINIENLQYALFKAIRGSKSVFIKVNDYEAIKQE